MPKYLQQRYRSWYAVLEIPRPLRVKFGGKRRFVQSLRTDSLKEAERRVLSVVAGWQQQIEAARTGSEAIESRSAEWRRLVNIHKGDGWTDEEIKEVSLDVATTNHEDDPWMVEAHALAFEDKHLLSEHIASYLASCKDVTPKTRDMREADIKRFSKKFKYAHEATRRAVIQWVEDDLISSKGLSGATSRRIISACRGYWDYLERHKGLNIPHPFDRVVPRQRRTQAQVANLRKSFLSEDYRKLLAGVPERDRQLADVIKVAAHTGARIEEICALTTDRVSDTELTIVDAKTESGWRKIPIHKDIFDLVADLKATSKDGYLISGLTKNKYDDRSNAVGKRFGRLKGRLGYGPDYVFHCFRKGVATQLEAKGVPENIVARLLGHEIKTMTYGLYSGGLFSYDQLKEVIDKVEW